MNGCNDIKAVFLSQSVRFPCGCKLTIEDEFEEPGHDVSYTPCGPPGCVIARLLPHVRVVFTDDAGSTTLKPSFTGPP